MTDKEQIIIDGKGCRYKTWDAECSLTGDHYGDNMKPCKFIDEKSCYYKPLVRKTQECEELKEENKVLQKLVSELEYSVQVGIELNARYRNALEEIEKYTKNFEELDIFEDIKGIINKAKGEENVAKIF